MRCLYHLHHVFLSHATYVKCCKPQKDLTCTLTWRRLNPSLKPHKHTEKTEGSSLGALKNLGCRSVAVSRLLGLHWLNPKPELKNDGSAVFFGLNQPTKQTSCNGPDTLRPGPGDPQSLILARLQNEAGKWVKMEMEDWRTAPGSS